MSQDAPPKGKLFPCEQCGAKIEFDPETRSLKCPYCGHATYIAELADDAEAEIVERDFEEYLEKLESGEGDKGTLAGHESQVRCTGCGAMVLLEDKIVTEKCPFCGTHLENKPESAAGMIPPESLAPFKHDFRHAREVFNRWIGSLWFAPTELKEAANLGQLNGVYVPYWTYDSMTNTRYRGQRGDNYTDTETYTTRDAQGNNVTQTRTVVRTRWTSVSGRVEHFFDDVLVCGSKSLPENLVSGLAPWNLEKLEPFNSDFLSGFQTERYAIGLKKGFSEAKRIMEPEIIRLIHRDIGGDHQRIGDKRTQYLAITFKHLLLPVWVANYRYREKLYQILVNGRTGAIAGERPWSAWKIARLVILILAALILLGVIVSKAKGEDGARRVSKGSSAIHSWVAPASRPVGVARVSSPVRRLQPLGFGGSELELRTGREACSTFTGLEAGATQQMEHAIVSWNCEQAGRPVLPSPAWRPVPPNKWNTQS